MFLRKNSIFNFILIFTFTFLLFSTTNDASARQGSLEKGQLKSIELDFMTFSPSLKAQYLFTDNIFLDNPDYHTHNDDFYWIFSPAMRIDFGTTLKHRFVLEYKADVTRYQQYDIEEHTSKYMWAFADFNFDNGFGIFAEITSDRYFETRRESLQKAFIEQLREYGTFGLKKTFNNHVRVQLEYSSDKWSFHDIWQQFRDRDEQAGRLKVFFGDIPDQFNPKSAYFFEYDYNDISYANARTLPYDYSNAIHEGFVGKSWATDDLSSYGTVKIGAAQIEFNEESTLALTGHGTFAYEIELFHTYGKKNSFVKLNGRKGIRQSEFYDAKYIDHTDIEGEVSVAAGDNYALFLNGSYVKDKFSDPIFFNYKREDEYGHGGLGFSYSTKDWYKFTLEHRINSRNSSYDFYDFDENLTSFTFELTI